MFQPRILFIDDEENILSSIRRLFKIAHIDIDVCSNPRQALEMVRSDQYQVVVSDNRMPDITGIELMELFSREHIRAVRMILTGQSGYDDALAAINRGSVYRFLSKPWDNHDLLKAVYSALLRYIRTAVADRAPLFLARLFGKSAKEEVINEAIRFLGFTDYLSFSGVSFISPGTPPASGYRIYPIEGRKGLYGSFVVPPDPDVEALFDADTDEYRVFDETLRGIITSVGLTLDFIESSSKLRIEAETDPLTGLPNRRGLDRLAKIESERHIRYHSPLSILLVDLDHFKDINDTYGHQAGDDALEKAAEIFQSAARSTDIVTRIGGDEFLLLLPGVESEGAVRLGERLLEESRKRPVCIGDEEIFLSFSMGAAVYPDGSADFERCFARADKALYQVKLNGRGSVQAAEN